LLCRLAKRKKRSVPGTKSKGKYLFKPWLLAMTQKAEKEYRNPYPTVDVVITDGAGLVLVSRKNPPYGWALPGGFVDEGESLEDAAVREALEETGLSVILKEQFYTYSDPRRDPRHHTISTVFIAAADGEPRGGDDAAEALRFAWGDLPGYIAFDHRQIIEDVQKFIVKGERPKP